MIESTLNICFIVLLLLVRKLRIQIPREPLTSCVTLDKSFICLSQFLHLYNRDRNACGSCLIGLLWDSKEIIYAKHCSNHQVLQASSLYRTETTGKTNSRTSVNKKYVYQLCTEKALGSIGCTMWGVSGQAAPEAKKSPRRKPRKRLRDGRWDIGGQSIRLECKTFQQGIHVKSIRIQIVKDLKYQAKDSGKQTRDWRNHGESLSP